MQPKVFCPWGEATGTMKRIVLLMAGNLSLSLGIAGIFLPVLPTTPFLLLSAACYVRSSNRLYHWLLGHKILGLYIRSWITYGAISIRAKIVSLLALWLVIGSTTIFFVDPWALRILLLIIALGVSIYLISMKTLTREMKEKMEDGEASGS